MANQLAPFIRTEGLTTSVLYIREKSYQRSIKNTTDSKKLRWWNFSASSLTIILLYQKFWEKSNFEVRIFLEVKFWKNGIGNIYLYIYLYTIISINLFYLLAAFFAAARSVSGARRAKKRSVYFAYCYILFYITIFILIL